MSNKVAVIGAGMTRFVRRAKESSGELAAQAVEMALRDAGLGIEDIDAVCLGTAPDAFDGIHLNGENVLAGCGGVGAGGSQQPTTAVVVLTIGPAETQDPLDVPAVVICGGVKVEYEPNPTGMVVIENVPFGSEDPPRQPLTVTAHGYRTASRWIELSRTTATYLDVGLEAVDLSKTGTIEGHVRDAQSGEGVANCMVRFTQQLPDTTIEVEGYTDAEGYFIIGGIPVGEVDVTAAAPGYLEWSGQVIVAADEGGGNEPLEVRIISGEARVDVRGIVLDVATQQPICGATVSLAGQTVQTGPDGRFVVSQVQVGEAQIVVTAEGYDRYEQTITVLPGMPELRIEMTPAAPEPPPRPYNVAGTVTIRNRPDNSGALVEAFNLQQSMVMDSYVTGPDGRYYLWVPPGEYEIRVHYEDRLLQRRLTVPGGGRIIDGVDFVLTMPP